MPFHSLLRDPRDRTPMLLTLLPVFAVAVWPAWPVVAVALWWTGNTVSHQAVHRRLFRAVWLERCFSVWLSLLLCVPQRLWRARHLAHHAGERCGWCLDRWMLVELAAIGAFVGACWLAAPAFVTGALLPGAAAGFGLCAVHGHFEHAGGTTSIHARWWNVLFLNDGYHAEHHLAPGRHYRDLPRLRAATARTSVLPPVLRWLGWFSPCCLLGAAERLVLHNAWLRRAVLAAHRRALRELLADVPAPRRIVVVGGGLFPRTALLLRELFPAAELHVLDTSPEHLDVARRWLPTGVVWHEGTFVAGARLDADLVVLPLAFAGDRAVAVRQPAAPLLLVHDWAWHPRGESRLVAWWLGKRLCLVRAEAAGVMQVA